jgi:hypothetical protein
MPRGDRTGPMGLGAMTGRAAGYCGGFGMPGYANSTPGRGYGMGLGGGRGAFGRGFGGGGRGLRNMFFATGLPGWARFGGYTGLNPNADSEMEKQALKRKAEALQVELDIIKRRLEEIQSEVTAQEAP